ncbi:MAG: radical SAM protein [Bacteroidota bacterium]
MASKFLSNYLPEFLAIGLTRSRPAMVTVNLTGRCNQRCIYCEIGHSPEQPEKDTLSVADLTWIIDQMVLNGIPKISLCGGEPFLFKGLIGLVDYAGSKNIRCSITTNGMTAHQLSLPELTILKKHGCEINISIDSFVEDVQSFTRGNPSALPNAIKSIQKLGDQHIPVTVLTVISKHNYRDLSQFVNTAWEKGIRQVLFQPVIRYSNYPGRPAIDDKSAFNVSAGSLDVLMGELNKILRFERKHKIKTNVYRILPWIGHYLSASGGRDGKWFFSGVLRKFYCREVDAIIDIGYNGEIQPCGLSPASITIFDNRNRGLKALWQQATEQIRDDLRHDRYYPFCNGCCHHFSRNMFASLMKYPVSNRAALFIVIPLLFSRVWWGTMKKLSVFDE